MEMAEQSAQREAAFLLSRMGVEVAARPSGSRLTPQVAVHRRVDFPAAAPTGE
jgi:hypothetical protein